MPVADPAEFDFREAGLQNLPVTLLQAIIAAVNSATGFSTNNVIPKGDGAGLVASGLSDDGTTVSVAGALNTTGNVTLGDDPASDTHTLNGVTTIKGGTSTAQAATAGTVLTVEQANATANYLTLRGTSAMGVLFANSSSSIDGGFFYGHTLARSLALLTSNTVRARILNTGTLAIGDTSSSTGVDNNVDVVQIGNTGTGQTASTALINATHSGSFDATAAQRNAVGVYVNMTSTRSAGANNVNNTALSVSASGAQVNYAIETDQGDNRFNVSGGSSSFLRNVNIGGYIAQTTENVAAQITADQNNYTPANIDLSAVLLVNSNAARNITGLLAGASGQWLHVYNTGSFNITLTHEDAASTAANRFRGRGNASVVLTPSTGVQLYYSPSLTRWVVMTDTL